MHRDGSRQRSSPQASSASERRSRGSAKQPYGVRPARPLPGERTATMSQVAPQKPLRAVRRLFKATGSILAVTAAGRDRSGNRDPDRSLCRSASRIVPVSARLGVRAASCGQWFNGFACLVAFAVPTDGFGSVGIANGHRFHGAGANPKATGSGIRRSGPSGSIGLGYPIPSWPLVAFALACPSSADSSPRRAGVRIRNSAWVHS